jgi:hypothetical protein
MINSRIAALKGTTASAAIMAAPGDWPGPALNDFLSPAQVVGAE